MCSLFAHRVCFLTAPAVLTLALFQSGCASRDSDKPWITQVLGDITPPTPGEAARDAFNVYDPDKRARSVALLSAAPFGGEAPYVRLYRLLIDDPDATVRAACAKALGEHGEVADSGLIIPLLNDRVAFVRWEAAKALQKIHSPTAVDPLINAAKSDEDTDVRMAAATALGQYPQPAVFDVLVGLLNDRDFGVVRAARQSLSTLTGQTLGYDSAAWLAWGDDNRGELFQSQRIYTYQPYEQPPGLLDKMQFWKKEEPVKPQVPTGLDTAAKDRDTADQQAG